MESSITTRASAGARTTVRVPPEVEPEIAALEGDGATRGAALQALLRAGADALVRERADRRAAEELRHALQQPPVPVAGHPSDAAIEHVIAEARWE